MGDGVAFPSGGSYFCNILFSIIPKLLVIVFAIVVAAYRTELLFAYSSTAINQDDDRKLPTRVCYYVDADDDVYGDRVCNNGITCAIISILVAMALMIIDLQIPCIPPTFKRLAHLLTLIWAVVLALYWLVINSMMANLYQRYCDSLEDDDDDSTECNDNTDKFVTFPVIGFICMGAWIGQDVMSLIRLIIGK